MAGPEWQDFCLGSQQLSRCPLDIVLTGTSVPWHILWPLLLLLLLLLVI